MNRPILAILLVGALALAGCTSTDESNDGASGSNASGGGSQVQGTMEVVENGAPPANETEETNTTNATNTSG